MLAPMAGLTTPGVRALCLELGAVAASTGLVDAEGLVRGDAGSHRRARWEGDGRRQVLQIFGLEPATIREAAALAGSLGFGGVELNLGCPAAPLARRGCGVAQLLDPRLSDQLGALREGSRSAGLRCGIKTRLGLREGDELVFGAWREAAAAGLDWFCLHPRTMEQGYAGRADWSALERLPGLPGAPELQAVGDIGSAAEARARLAEHPRLAAVLVGRAAITAPWIFCREEPELSERAGLLAELLRRLACEGGLEEGGAVLEVLDGLLGLGHGAAAQMRLADRRRLPETAATLRRRLAGEPPPRLEGNPFLRH
jgi:tRNA-dihydrouridine synthase B